ncbi:hypothetical protein [Caldimonas tepidiphila]|uniref:hypothetical protein n=1 Tax=Caldimonas tepidiphila TaxID=2315841 RepID=UPI001300AC98|nr:hypothetical protein [Caldimonas tepidiphila]
MADQNPATGPRDRMDSDANRGNAAQNGGRDRSDKDPEKEIQGGTRPAQTGGTQLGERSTDAMDVPERGGMASTDGRTNTEGGVGSAERSMNQERSRGGQMGPGGGDERR